jgi:hypothetical protein
MLDNIISSLTEQAMPKLTGAHGLSPEQAKNSITAAVDGLKGTLGGDHGFDLGTVTNLFSSATNTDGANGLLEKIAGNLQGDLVSKAGLNADQATSVKNTLLPMITDLVTKHVGGNAGALQGMLSSFTGGGGIADMAKGALGKLFK